MQFDDFPGHCKAEAGSLADFLGGEEGLEDLLLHVFRNARAVVLDLDDDIVGGDNGFFIVARAVPRVGIRRAQLDPSAFGHGVARIHDEIDDDLFELVEVGLHEPQVASVLEIDLDLFAHEATQENLEVGQDIAELQDLRAQRLAAREGEQLSHQTRSAVGVLLDLHDVLEGRIGWPVIGEQQIRISDDGGEHVVEVMRDAARELADGLHLLGLG